MRPVVCFSFGRRKRELVRTVHQKRTWATIHGRRAWGGPFVSADGYYPSHVEATGGGGGQAPRRGGHTGHKRAGVGPVYVAVKPPTVRGDRVLRVSALQAALADCLAVLPATADGIGEWTGELDRLCEARRPGRF